MSNRKSKSSSYRVAVNFQLQCNQRRRGKDQTLQQLILVLFFTLSETNQYGRRFRKGSVNFRGGKQVAAFQLLRNENVWSKLLIKRRNQLSAIPSNQKLSSDIASFATRPPNKLSNGSMILNKSMLLLNVTNTTSIFIPTGNVSNVTKSTLSKRQPLRSAQNTNGFRSKLAATRQQRQAAQMDDLPLPPLSQAYCDFLFAECVAHDEWVLVLDVIDLMREAGVRQLRSTYNACLQACFQTANAACAREVLSTMLAARIDPEITDYTLAILAMCQKDQTEMGWCDQALKLLQEVTEKSSNDLPLGVYDAVLACLVKERQWKTSIRLLRGMELPVNTNGEGFNRTQPALSTYRTVIECCVAANQANQAALVLKSCTNRGLIATSYSFELVIAALAKNLQWRQAVQLIDLMEELNVPRTLKIYNFLLASCSKAREAVPAKSLLQRMKRRDRIAPNVVSYNSVLFACASTSQWRDALSILDQAHREPGVTPDICTYTK
jgi:pentatricopeptide repeat protein